MLSNLPPAEGGSETDEQAVKPGSSAPGGAPRFAVSDREWGRRLERLRLVRSGREILRAPTDPLI